MSWAGVVAVVGVVVVAAVAFRRHLKKLTVKFFGASVEASGKDQGVSVKNVKSRRGEINAVSETGSSVSVEGADAYGDINASSKGGTDPKR
jgi:hypothetical protein